MVHFSDHDVKIICNNWKKIDPKCIGGEALARLLCVNPWTQRYFSAFGNLGSADAICHNAKVLEHGAKVLNAITESFKHLDNLKGHLAALSLIHADKLHVDPANFSLFFNTLVIVLALHLKTEFTPEVQCVFQRVFRAVTEALAHAYH